MRRSSAMGLGDSRRSPSSVWRGSRRAAAVGRSGWTGQCRRVDCASTAVAVSSNRTSRRSARARFSTRAARGHRRTPATATQQAPRRDGVRNNSTRRPALGPSCAALARAQPRWVACVPEPWPAHQRDQSSPEAQDEPTVGALTRPAKTEREGCAAAAAVRRGHVLAAAQPPLQRGFGPRAGGRVS